VIPPGFWDNAKMLLPVTKQQITLRLDPEVIRFFKATGKGYQSRMGGYCGAMSRRSGRAERTCPLPEF
jgi:hypothetical protein